VGVYALSYYRDKKVVAVSFVRFFHYPTIGEYVHKIRYIKTKPPSATKRWGYSHPKRTIIFRPILIGESQKTKQV
jgi:hypothetical protein